MRLRGMKDPGGVRVWGMTGLTRIHGNVLAGMPLDRAAHLRTDAAWLAARLDDPSTRFLAIWRQNAVVRLGPEPRAVIHYRETLDGLLDARAEAFAAGRGGRGRRTRRGALRRRFLARGGRDPARPLARRRDDGSARAGADRAGHGRGARGLRAGAHLLAPAAPLLRRLRRACGRRSRPATSGAAPTRTAGRSTSRGPTRR